MKALVIVTLPDSCRKICDGSYDVDLFMVLEDWVDVPCGGISLPCLIVFLLILGDLRSDPIINCFPSRHGINRCVHLVGRVNLVQDFSCGRGEWF